MRGKLQTTGELREFLGEIMVMVKDGEIDLNKANCITKIATQINTSFFSEVQAAKIRLLNREATPTLGSQELGTDYRGNLIEGEKTE